MKKTFLFILLLINGLAFCQQKIYKNFIEGMSQDEVSTIFESNQASLLAISFTTSVSWDVSPNRFIYEENQLKVVALIPNGMGNGFNYIKTFTHLKESKSFLENLGYQVIFENEWWDRPQNFVNKSYPYGLVLQTPDKKIEVNLYVYKEKGSYKPVMYIFPTSYRTIHFQNNAKAEFEENGF